MHSMVLFSDLAENETPLQFGSLVPRFAVVSDYRTAAGFHLPTVHVTGTHPVTP